MGILGAGKKKRKTDNAKIEVPELPDVAPDDEPGELKQVTENLAKLEELLNRTREQVTDYLLRRESQGTAAAAENGNAGVLADKLDQLAEKLDQLEGGGGAASKIPAGEQAAQAAGEETLKASLQPLQERLEQIEATLKSLGDKTAEDGSQDAVGMVLAALRDGINEQHNSLLGAIGELQQRVDAAVQNLAQNAIQQLHRRVDAGLQEIADMLRPEKPDEAAGPASNSDWQRAILGVDLARHPALDFQRHQLLGGVLDGNDGACSLAGQLLVFRSAMTDKMPQLLKDIGEAYYRWQPKTTSQSNTMETALVNWLKEACAEAGIGNTVELVHPGERFDSTRHTAATRGGGVEITKVLGWIVLRDNGKVYTKASVEVK